MSSPILKDTNSHFKKIKKLSFYISQIELVICPWEFINHNMDLSRTSLILLPKHGFEILGRNLMLDISS